MIKWRQGLLAVLSVLALAGPAPAPGHRQDTAAATDFQEFTLGLPNGLVDVSALDLPGPFLRRVADRSLRSSFHIHHRRVAAGSRPTSRPAEPPRDLGGSLAGISVRTKGVPVAMAARWRAFDNGVPPLRGFRAPLLALRDDPWPVRPPTGEQAERYREAATYVARHLARRGLVRTTMTLLRDIDLSWRRGGSLDEAKLRAAGIPTDLLAFFHVGEEPLARALARWLDHGAPPEAIDRLAARSRFAFTPSCPAFVVTAEDGSEEVGGYRIQLRTNTFVLGRGDGSPLDIFRQLALVTRTEKIWTSIQARHVPGLLREMSTWSILAPEQLTVISSPAELSPWAQDNGKAGLAPRADDPTRREVVTLIPRYASRNDQITIFLPGETLVFETLEEEIGRCVVSPLLFQGGNALAVIDPRSGERLLLLGEAEVYRNRGLGLTMDQILEAFRVEFGVDRCVVMPAISFHIDMDLTVRRCDDELVACLADEVQASRIIVGEALEPLGESGLVDEARLGRLTQRLRRGELTRVTPEIRRILGDLQDQEGRLSAQAAELLVTSPLELPVANARRFLLALDVLTAASMTTEQLDDLPLHERRYLESHRRREADRAAMAKSLRALGMRVHRVPSLGDGQAGINYLNAVHLPSAALIPVYDGFYAALDQAAQAAYARAFGPSTRVVPIATANAQTRSGGLHCMLSVYPAPPPD